MKSLRF
jgi:hypothetical protein